MLRWARPLLRLLRVTAAAATVLGPGLAASAHPGDGRTLRPSQVFTVTARGFARSVVVDVRTVGIVSDQTARSDLGGVVHLAYRVSSRPGAYILLLAGPAAGAATAGPADVTVSVPLVVRLPYRVAGVVAPAAGVDAQSSVPTTASTGVDVGHFSLLGAGLLIAGGVALTSSRRRRPDTRPRRPGADAACGGKRPA